MAIPQLPNESKAVFIFLLVSGLMLNVIGIYCILKGEQKSKKKAAQTVILVNLSAVEILSSIYLLVMVCGSFMVFTKEQALIARHVQIVIYHGLTLLMYSSMIFISADRFVGTYYPMKYYTSMRASKAKKIVIGIWSLSILSAAPFAFKLVSHDVHKRVILYTAYVAQAIFILLSLITYSSAFVKRILNLNSLNSLSATPTRPMQQSKKKKLIPFLIIISFVLLYQIPHYVQTSSPIVKSILIATTYVGISIDPLIYIFLNEAHCRILKEIVSASIRRHANEMIMMLAVPTPQTRRESSDVTCKSPPEQAQAVTSLIYEPWVSNVLPMGQGMRFLYAD